METMYPGIPFSPQATLTASIGEADTIIKVSDVSAFPDAPNYATIGTDEGGETILYTAKTTDSLSGCQRGVEGAAKAWAAGELIGRNFTAADHKALIENVKNAAKTAEADGVTFEDGETFQEKYDNGELTGKQGEPGTPGTPGPQGPGANTISVSLPSSGWADGAQTVQNEALVASDYAYIVTPAPASFGSYASCMVRADNVTTDGAITFYCEDAPTVDLTVSIMKVKVEG